MAQSAGPVPGLIMVPMSLKPGLSVAECDDWYNNEHVPIRMKLPYFQRGYRYRSKEVDLGGTDASGLPPWLALYDITDMHELTKERYNRLLTPSVQSQRESEIIGKVEASRKYYDLVSTYEAPDFLSREELMRQGRIDKAYGGTLVVVGVRLTSDLSTADAEREWDRWYEQDHLPPLRRVPGWLRTRRYRTSVIEDVTPVSKPGCSTVEFLTLNEFADDAAIGGPEHQVAIRTETKTNVVTSKWRHSYKLHYLQSPASRDLAALQRTETKHFISPDGLTRTRSGPQPRIESYIVSSGNHIVRYSIEGALAKDAPTIVVCCLSGHEPVISNGTIENLVLQATKSSYRVLRLELPIRDDDRDCALSQSKRLETVEKDLETCFQALLMGKAALILAIGLGGKTTEDGGAQHVMKETQSPGFAGLGEKTALIVCETPEEVEKKIENLGGGPRFSEILQHAISNR